MEFSTGKFYKFGNLREFKQYVFRNSGATMRQYTLDHTHVTVIFSNGNTGKMYTFKGKFKGGNEGEGSFDVRYVE